jgi:hypothetical protein
MECPMMSRLLAAAFALFLAAPALAYDGESQECGVVATTLGGSPVHFSAFDLTYQEASLMQGNGDWWQASFRLDGVRMVMPSGDMARVAGFEVELHVPSGTAWITPIVPSHSHVVSTVEGNAGAASTASFALGDGSVRLFADGQRIDSLDVAFGSTSTQGEGDI